MVSTVVLEPTTATSIPESAKKAAHTTPSRRERTDIRGDHSTPRALAETGGASNNPPKIHVPQVHEGTVHGEDGMTGQVNPITKTTSSTPSDTVTITPQVYVTPALRKLTTEARVYLASGEESDQNLVYTPQSCGSRTPNHGAQLMASLTSATDQPASTDTANQRHNPLEVSLSLRNQEDCYWATYNLQHESRRA